MLTAERARRAAIDARERAERITKWHCAYNDWWCECSMLDVRVPPREVASEFAALWGTRWKGSVWACLCPDEADYRRINAEADELRAFAKRAERYADDLEAAGDQAIERYGVRS